MKLDDIRSAIARFIAPGPRPVRESAGALGTADDETGWRRLTAGGTLSSERDLAPLSQDRMQRAAEWLWQRNTLANRLVEIPLAYLLAEGVKLECDDEAHQALLDKHWRDPINDWPGKLMQRARDLALMGEQCYVAFENEFSGHVRLGYVDPRLIATIVTDPDNPEQPIGVVTRKDRKGNARRYRVIVLGPDEELFSARTAGIRQSFADGDAFLFQVNKLATGSRGRSDMLAQIDWVDAYDEFLFGELDRTRFLRSFVWDLEMKGATPDQVNSKAKDFKPPEPNSVYVHNDQEVLTPKQPALAAADTAEGARLFRNHVLGGATMPEHWFGGGGDVNRAAAAEMGDPAFKMFTVRQTQLKIMLETIGRYVLSRQPDAKPDWADAAWQVRAVFPEMVSRDLTKFAAAMQGVSAAVVTLLDKGLITELRAVSVIADVAKRFGQEFDAAAELKDAIAERDKRRAERAAMDSFALALSI